VSRPAPSRLDREGRGGADLNYAVWPRRPVLVELPAQPPA